MRILKIIIALIPFTSVLFLFENCSNSFRALDDGSNAAASVNPTPTPTPSSSATPTPTPTGGTALRPSYNKGIGFFVLNGKLYDANGNEFDIRGLDKVHWDNGSPGLAKSNANAVRWDMDFTQAPASNVSVLMGGANQTSGTVYDKMAVIPGNWDGTCADGSVTPPASGMAPVTPTLQGIINTWVSQAASWTQLEKYSIINIANEWGPSNSTVWRDNYIQAISALRMAGYHATILVDSGGCGQDEADLQIYSQAVFQSDPEKNVMFAQHLYGTLDDYSATIASIKQGNPTVITLNSNSSTHPFAPSFNGTNNSYSGINEYYISGANGLGAAMAPNGQWAASQNVGGTAGAWTITLNVDSTNWPAYNGGATIVDYTGNYALRIGRMSAMAEANGTVYIIGEFGPGRDIGPSPTMVTPTEILTAAEQSGVPWLAWAWDDNNLVNSQSDNNWFSMSYLGNYSSSADLTMFGQQVVEGCTNANPGGCGCPDTDTTSVVEPGCKGTPAPQYQPYSLKLATPASIFK